MQPIPRALTSLLLRGRLALLLISLFSLATFAAPAQEGKAVDDALHSGPPAGTASTPVLAYAPVGAHAGKEYDAISRIGNGPGALLFVHELTRNALPVIRAIDEAAADLSLLGLETCTLMLSDDRTAMETKLKGVNASLKLHNPIVLSLDGADGPGNYALNRKAVLTLVILDQGKVVRSAAFTDVNEKDSATVREWITAVTGELPNDPKQLRALAEKSLPEDDAELRDFATAQTLELRRLRGQVAQLKRRLQEANYASRMGGGSGGRPQGRQMSRDGSQPPSAEKSATPDADNKNQRQGSPPTDGELSALLRTIIRQDNDLEANDSAFAAIKARAAESDELHAQVVEMFKLMLSYRDRYGNDYAQELAESYLKSNARKAKQDE